MKTTIYYFSGTGNTKFVAEQIAEKLHNTNIITIPSIIDDTLIECEERVGIMLPVYVWGLPEIVERFLRKADFSNTKYLFIGITGGGSAGNCVNQAKKVLEKRGITLNYGFFIGMPGNATTVYNAFEKEKCNKLISEAKTKVLDVCTNINNNVNKIEKFHFIFTILNKLMYNKWRESLSTFDSDFTVTKDCNGCDICVEGCPVDNIEMKDGIPIFLGNCQNCLACYNSCPELAIKVKGDKNKRRYIPSV